MSKLKKIILASLLLATTIVLSRFLSINTPILTINFSFISIMLSAILLGPFYSTLVAGLADLIGALLFPFGAYFVGYTISSALQGLIYGLLIYQGKKELSNKKFIFRLLISTFLVLLICNTVLNTLWIYITTKKALFAILPTRLLKQLIMLPIQVVTMFFITIGLKKLFPNYFAQNDSDDEPNSETINNEPIEANINNTDITENVKNNNLTKQKEKKYKK